MLPSTLSQLFYKQIRDTSERSNRVYDPVIGVVVDNKDPDKLARVKIKIPSLGMTETTWWAPLVSLGAGKDRGWFFLPEIDDEVLVMFESGEMNRPMVIGALWNGKDAPADKNDGANERRSIVSREGSKIVLDDDKKEITIEDGTGLGKITIKEDKIIIEATQNDVCVQAPMGELNIVAKEFKGEATQNFHIQANAAAKMSSDGKVTIKGGSMLKIHGATTSINGGAAAAGETSEGDVADSPPR